ncbi:hypothetical protein BOX15_Mlig012849g1 [Macrostomum lignano]|uniref:Rho-GAP domain-containing protein n=1 Tax=Macrostomum lignano TaxID=282301 RepID=A0A267DBP0_9PLAT|nr:hypothetical protein BOX15_Mlig012849g1 [Macrostomum lignano]
MESPLMKQKSAAQPPQFLAGLLRLPSRPKLNQQHQLQRSFCCHGNSVSSDGKFFGRPLELQPTTEVPGLGAVPAILAACCDHLASHVTDEGLFRVEAPRSRLVELRRQLDAGAGVGEATPPRDVACALKAWLRELPEPLLPPAIAQELAEAAAVGVADDDGARARDLLRRRCRPPAVSPSQLRALRHLCEFLAKVARHSASNRMDADNLATCLGPCLLRHVGAAAAASAASPLLPPASPRDAVARLNAAAALLVRHHQALGAIDSVTAVEPPPPAVEAGKRGRSGSCSGSGGSFAALRAAVGRFASRSRSRSPGSRRGQASPFSASSASSTAAARPRWPPHCATWWPPPPLAGVPRRSSAAAVRQRRVPPRRLLQTPSRPSPTPPRAGGSGSFC